LNSLIKEIIDEQLQHLALDNFGHHNLVSRFFMLEDFTKSRISGLLGGADTRTIGKHHRDLCLLKIRVAFTAAVICAAFDEANAV
jgi:hypothetical protein